MPVLEPCGCSFSIAYRSKLHIECAMHANLRASNNEAVRLLREAHRTIVEQSGISDLMRDEDAELLNEIDAYLARVGK